MDAHATAWALTLMTASQPVLRDQLWGQPWPTLCFYSKPTKSWKASNSSTIRRSRASSKKKRSRLNSFIVYLLRDIMAPSGRIQCGSSRTRTYRPRPSQGLSSLRGTAKVEPPKVQGLIESLSELWR